ncbi:MAG: hypothetical protein IT377_12735 [Polyangiaceae bacterium]|nr:hypothetical protein [Polyangiaceae bacterium]
MARVLLLLWVFVFVACGDDGSTSGTGGAAGTGGTGASGGSAGTGGVPPADGPFACGTTTCSASQYCIHPCCGGAPPMCEPKPEGGTCPAGYHDGCQTGSCSSPSGCCEMDPCKPAPPYCADQPEAGCSLQGHDCHMACA